MASKKWTTMPNSSVVDVVDFHRQRERMEEMRDIVRGLSYGVEDLFLGRLPGTSCKEDENYIAEEEEEVVPISSDRNNVNIVPPPLPPEPPPGGIKNFEDEVVTISNRLMPPSPRSPHHHGISDSEDAISDVESVAESSDDDLFMEFGEADFPDELPPWEDEGRMNQASTAYESVKEFMLQLRAEGRFEIMCDVSNWFQSKYASGVNYIKQSGNDEEGVTEASHEFEEARHALNEFSKSLDKEHFMKLNTFMQSLRNNAKGRGHRARKLRKETMGRQEKIHFSQLVSAVWLLDRRLQRLHQKAQSEGRLAAVFARASMIAKQSAEDDEHQDIDTIDDDVVHEKEKRIEASDLLELISDQQNEIQNLEGRMAISQEHLDALEGCISLVQWENDAKRHGNLPPPGRRRDSAILGQLRQTDTAMQDEILALLEATRSAVKERALRKHTEENPQLYIDLMQKIDPNTVFHLESEREELKYECDNIERYNEYLEGILRSESLTKQLTVVMEDVVVPMPAPPKPPDPEDFWKEMFPEEALQDTPRNENNAMVQLFHSAQNMLGNLQKQRARLLPKSHAEARRNELATIANNSSYDKSDKDISLIEEVPITKEAHGARRKPQSNKNAEPKAKPQAKNPSTIAKRLVNGQEALKQSGGNSLAQDGTFESAEYTASFEHVKPTKKPVAIGSKTSAVGSGTTGGVVDSKASTAASSGGFAMIKQVISKGSSIQHITETMGTMTTVDIIAAEKSSEDHLVEVNNISSLLQQEVEELETKIQEMQQSDTEVASAQESSQGQPTQKIDRRAGRKKTKEKTKVEMDKVEMDRGSIESEHPADSELLSVQLENSKLKAEVEVLLARIASANETAERVEEELKKEQEDEELEERLKRRKKAATTASDVENRGDPVQAVKLEEKLETAHVEPSSALSTKPHVSSQASKDPEMKLEIVETDAASDSDKSVDFDALLGLGSPTSPSKGKSGRGRQFKKQKSRDRTQGPMSLFDVASKAVDAKKAAKLEQDVLELYDLHVENNKVGKDLEVLEQRIKNVRNKESGAFVAEIIAQKMAGEKQMPAKAIPEAILNLRQDVGKKQLELKKLRKFWCDRGAPSAQKKKMSGVYKHTEILQSAPRMTDVSPSSTARDFLSCAAHALQAPGAPSKNEKLDLNSWSDQCPVPEDTPMRRFSRVIQSGVAGVMRQPEASRLSTISNHQMPLASLIEEPPPLPEMSSPAEDIPTRRASLVFQASLAMPSPATWTKKQTGRSSVVYHPICQVQSNSPLVSPPGSAPSNDVGDSSLMVAPDSIDEARTQSRAQSRDAHSRFSQISAGSLSSVRTTKSRLSAVSQMRRKHALAMGRRSSAHGSVGSCGEDTPEGRRATVDSSQRFKMVARALI